MRASPATLLWFRLALALGIPVRELQGRMDAREFGCWAAFQTIEPFGDARGDMQAAIIASTIANVNRGKSQSAFSIDDFLPRFLTRRQSPEDMLAMMKQHASNTSKG